MSSIALLHFGPIFEQIGWALVHFLWQGTLLALLLAYTLRLLRDAPSQIRYAAACLTLGLMACLPVATLIWLSNAEMIAGLSQSDPQSVPIGLSRWATSALSIGQTFLPALVALWLAGVAFSSIRLGLDWGKVQRLRRASTVPAERQWQVSLRILSLRLGLQRPVQLVETTLLEVPAVIGWLRPVILLPPTALIGLTRAQVTALIAHELAHVLRQDYCVNLLQNGIETLLFFHPAVRWVSQQIRQEREDCCDDLAIAACGDRMAYALALAVMEELRTRTPRIAAAASGGVLVQRIQRIVGVTASRVAVVRLMLPLLAGLMLSVGMLCSSL